MVWRCSVSLTFIIPVPLPRLTENCYARLSCYEEYVSCRTFIFQQLIGSLFLEIATYLDQPHIRRVLGVDQSIGNYSSCNNKVNGAFQANMDSLHPTQLYVGALLERGVKVLIYVGTSNLPGSSFFQSIYV